ncbi:lysozyme [Oscillatoria sp. FACHB-1407]|uniref:lysozyme n=1 Tax=Oscillatoria sp. FACHB-1407 TaxID=2692847 RepID=UPI0016868BF3|nr:lysozyme [Oscillatoria sp. FACHB-1407]MBD2465104.1 lysozyme [Oscillatoria sp. FACHB-1407]
MATPANTRLVLRITQPTLLKRRVAAEADLLPEEKVLKDPCRIYLHSYAYAVPGEDLQDHYKVCFEAPFNGSSVWYVHKSHSLIEGATPPPPPTAKPQPAPQPSTPQPNTTKPGKGKINQAGLDLIKQFEGLKLEAYICPAGVPTIGYGTTAGVKMGDRITAEQAEVLLRKDVEKFERAVVNAVKVPLTENQFSALVSFTYNLGAGALQKSTLLKLLNQGNYEAAAQEFPKWNKAAGKVLTGLTRRRQAEQALFLKK